MMSGKRKSYKEGGWKSLKNLEPEWTKRIPVLSDSFEKTAIDT